MYSREAFLVHLCVRKVEIEKFILSWLAKKSGQDRDNDVVFTNDNGIAKYT
jgi:hypothetical protein